MNKFLTWFVCLLLCGSIHAQTTDGSPAPKPTSAAPADATALQFVLQLTDGSRITGTPAIDRFKITTHYGDMEVLFSRMRKVDFNAANGTTLVGLQNGDELSGKLALTEIAMKTAAGPVVVPLAHVRKIRVGAIGADMPEGLVLHYSFDTNEGEKVTDSSGAGNHGKVLGATYTDDGQIFGAMSFSGDGDAVIVGNPKSLQLQNFTIMAWIKRGSTEKTSKTEEYGEIFGYGAGGYIMGLDQGGNLYLSQTEIHFGASSTFVVNDKEFHHVAVTKDGTKYVFYLDGVAYPAEDFQTEGDFVFTTDAAVGARSDNLHRCFLGVIDEVAVFKRPLSADEVKAVYESQK